MDPNAALELIRRLVKESDASHIDDYAQMLEELAFAVDGLDSWISSGGFLPDAWQVAR